MHRWTWPTLLLVLAPASYAQEGFFVDFSGAASFGNGVDGSGEFADLTDVGDETGAAVGVGVGFEWANGFGTRLAYTFRDVENSQATVYSSPLAGRDVAAQIDDELHSHLLTIEGVYRFELDWPVTPYIAAGVGLARNGYKADLFVPELVDDLPAGVAYGEKKSNELAWTMSVGLRYELLDALELSAELGMVDIGRVASSRSLLGDTLSRDDFRATELRIGGRWRF